MSALLALAAVGFSSTASSEFYGFSANLMADGTPVSMSAFKDKPVLIINVASF